MNEPLLNEHAFYWGGGFLLIYVLVQILVSKHSRFQLFSPIQKSIAVKVLALVGFVLAYLVVKFLTH